MFAFTDKLNHSVLTFTEYTETFASVLTFTDEYHSVLTFTAHKQQREAVTSQPVYYV